MIQKVINECAEENKVTISTTIYFLGIPIYEYVLYSTNKELVEKFKVSNKPAKVKGYKQYENKSKTV